MGTRVVPFAVTLMLGMLALPGGEVRAEVIEEIVAWVDGEIITRSELQTAEQELIGELYREYSGEELDRQVEANRSRLLQEMIDRMILVHRAGRIFDLDLMGDSLLDHVKEQQQVEDDAELDRLLAQQGYTREAFRKTLVRRVAPEEVIKVEVGSRVSVGDKKVEAYYLENQEQFDVEAEVLLREIVLLVEDGDHESRREEAQAIHARASSPDTDFAALARQVSEAGTKEDGGILGPLKVSDLSEALAGAALSVPVGSVSELLEVSYGFHICKVESRTDAHRRPLEEVREEIRGALEDRDYFSRLEEFLGRARSESSWRVAEKYKDRLPKSE